MNAATVVFVLISFVPFIDGNEKDLEDFERTDKCFFGVCWPFDCPADKNESWTYRGKKGPPYWGETYPKCYGKNQSPIDITPEIVERGENLERLVFNNYDQLLTKAKIVNNGHTIQVTPEDGVVRSITINGTQYSLLQFHFHWGDAYWKGSEHKINGTCYAMEIHFVYNSTRGLAVVGIIGVEQHINNSALDGVVQSLPNLIYKDMQTELKTSINLTQFLPITPASYYRYDGSLTTPPCDEGVTWSVLTRLIKVGKRQLKEFRKLSSARKGEGTARTCPLSNNFRPVQPLNGRKVYISQ